MYWSEINMGSIMGTDIIDTISSIAIIESVIRCSMYITIIFVLFKVVQALNKYLEKK